MPLISMKYYLHSLPCRSNILPWYTEVFKLNASVSYFINCYCLSKIWYASTSLYPKLPAWSIPVYQTYYQFMFSQPWDAWSYKFVLVSSGDFCFINSLPFTAISFLFFYSVLSGFKCFTFIHIYVVVNNWFNFLYTASWNLSLKTISSDTSPKS